MQRPRVTDGNAEKQAYMDARYDYFRSKGGQARKKAGFLAGIATGPSVPENLRTFEGYKADQAAVRDSRPQALNSATPDEIEARRRRQGGPTTRGELLGA